MNLHTYIQNNQLKIKVIPNSDRTKWSAEIISAGPAGKGQG